MIKRQTKIQQSIFDNSEKVIKVKNEIKIRADNLQNRELVQEELSTEFWKDLSFNFPNNTIRLATVFSGIGAIEHAFIRLNLNFKIVFAGDIDANCKKVILQITILTKMIGLMIFVILMLLNIKIRLIS